MNKDPIDDKIIELLKHDGTASNLEISRKLGISEEDVKKRIGNLSETRPKVLIVDDEMDTLLPLKKSLEAGGYIVVEALNGQEALNMVKDEIPDIILLDIMLPGMDGYEVCSRLKNNALTKNIPIIMLTARDNVKEKVKGLETGADDYVAKPYNLHELKARIKSVLRRSRNM
ncbi:MAG: response regulator [Candidatus Methanoperedens sp.]|nr:response regulator [Candidatus Methanoperedens sp.]MCZ7405529.1 response regulator [Candidatus Methanoperedens sp.]